MVDHPSYKCVYVPYLSKRKPAMETPMQPETTEVHRLRERLTLSESRVAEQQKEIEKLIAEVKTQSLVLDLQTERIKELKADNKALLEALKRVVENKWEPDKYHMAVTEALRKAEEK